MSKIFISYRREDAAGYAISLHDRLADRFGTDQIFMDIDNIEPGEDFIEVINEKVSACDVLLVLIGRDWLTCKDEAGQRRLDIHDDFVRLEVAAALNRKIRVVPVLVGGARQPKPDELPTELASLCRRNAVAVTDAGFRQDVNRLIDGIEKVIRASGTSAHDARQHPGSAPVVDAASPGSQRAEVVPPILSHGEAEVISVPRKSDQRTDGEEITVGQERIFRGHSKPVKTIAFAPDNAILASAGGGSWLGGGDTAIRLWRVSDGRLLHELAGHIDTVRKIAFSPSGDLLASCCSKAVHLWRASDGKRLRTLEGATGIVGNNLAFSADGSKLACWLEFQFKIPELENYEPQYSFWSISDGRYLLLSYDGLLQQAEFRWERTSPDGQISASGERIKTEQDEYWALVVKRVADGATLLELKDGATGGVEDPHFSADGRLLVASYADYAIRLWRLADGKRFAKIQLSTKANSVGFSPDGRWLGAGCEDKLVRVWPLRWSSSV